VLGRVGAVLGGKCSVVGGVCRERSLAQIRWCLREGCRDEEQEPDTACEPCDPGGDT